MRLFHLVKHSQWNYMKENNEHDFQAVDNAITKRFLQSRMNIENWYSYRTEYFIPSKMTCTEEDLMSETEGENVG